MYYTKNCNIIIIQCFLIETIKKKKILLIDDVNAISYLQKALWNPYDAPQHIYIPHRRAHLKGILNWIRDHAFASKFCADKSFSRSEAALNSEWTEELYCTQTIIINDIIIVNFLTFVFHSRLPYQTMKFIWAIVRKPINSNYRWRKTSYIFN